MGARINLNSPKQLGEMLFDKMGLPAPKKTKRGYSTSAEVLENLAARASRSARRFWNIASIRSWNPPTSTRCSNLQRRRRAHPYRASIRRPRPRGASAPRSRTCRTFPVRTELGREIRARLSSPGRAACWWTRTIPRSSCACWPTCPATRRCIERLPRGAGHPQPHGRRRCSACRWSR